VARFDLTGYLGTDEGIADYLLVTKSTVSATLVAFRLVLIVGVLLVHLEFWGTFAEQPVKKGCRLFLSYWQPPESLNRLFDLRLSFLAGVRIGIRFLECILEDTLV